MSEPRAVRGGVYPVVPTPLREDYTPDEEGLRAIIRFLIERGVHGLTILGSNGEFPYFTLEERVRVTRAAVRAAGGRVPVVVGTGAMGTDETVEITQRAKDEGADAALVALPTYYPVRFTDVLLHYKKVTGVGLPILFYHFPDCTRLRLVPAQVAEICEMEGIVGMKASILSFPTLRAYVARIRKRPFAFFSGVTYLLRPFLSVGGEGLICPVSAIFPEPAVGLYTACREGDAVAAQRHERHLSMTLPLMSGSDLPWRLLMAGFQAITRTGIGAKATGGGSPAIIKEALRLRGLPIRPLVRRPLAPLTPVEAARAKRVVDALARNESLR